MEENTSTWWAVQFLTQQQATHCQGPEKTHNRAQRLCSMTTVSCAALMLISCFHKGNLLLYVQTIQGSCTLKQEVNQQETQYARGLICQFNTNIIQLVFCLHLFSFYYAPSSVCIFFFSILNKDLKWIVSTRSFNLNTAQHFISQFYNKMLYTDTHLREWFRKTQPHVEGHWCWRPCRGDSSTRYKSVKLPLLRNIFSLRMG